jgi:hypothetical protein
VRGGAASGVANAPAAVALNAKVFEQAREASQQRAATSLAVADEIDLARSDVESLRVGSKIFLKRGDTWVDAAKADTARTVRIKPFSDAYFKLIGAIPELREVFALGDKVIVGTKAVTIELAEDGSQAISDSDLKTIRSSW